MAEDTLEYDPDSPYAKNQNELYRMLRQGASFSGNERHCCFLNLQNGRFATISAVSGFDFLDDGRGLALVDWDQDGDNDCWIANRTGPRLRLLRNDRDDQNHFLAVQLEGVHCNRDAVGARVDVVLRSSDPSRPPTTLCKSLHAGEGFMAQSTKCLLFGLGQNTDIAHVLIRWPNGTQEQVDGLVADRRYRIVEGTSTATEVTINTTSPLTAGTVTPGKSEPQIVARLTGPVPLPHVEYEGFDRVKHDLSPYHGSPVLLHLWASWCVPCLHELNEWSQNATSFNDINLRVIALSVDGLDPQHNTDSNDAESALQKIGFPFHGGIANAALLQRLQLANDQIFGLQYPLPVPTSFLLDESGCIRAIYKGRVSREIISRDVQLLTNRSNGNLPLATDNETGRWFRQPRYNLAYYADAFLEQGYRDDVRTMLTSHRDLFVNSPQLAAVFAKLGDAARRENDFLTAERHFRDAVAIDADNAQMQNNLGSTLHLSGQSAEAMAHFRQAIELAPEDPQIRANLSLVLLALKQFDSAIAQLREAVRLAPDNPTIRLSLAEVLRTSGRVEDAVGEYQTASALAPNDARILQNLSVAYMAQGKMADAIEPLASAVKLDENNASIHKNLGLCLALTGRKEEAIVHLTRSLQLNPHDASVANNLGGLYAGAGDWDQAIRYLERAAGLAPTNEKFRRNLAAAREAQGRDRPTTSDPPIDGETEN